ncbi:MAG: galactokinase [Chthoniobacterales bacterium]|nr:galactokinase [Chthoniobacterales bacterium]
MTAQPLLSAYAPGRVELLGNHTDYNDGVVLGAAIDRGLTMRGSKSTGGMISVSSKTMGCVEVGGSEIRPLVDDRWANYVLGVVSELRSLSIPIAGFSAEITGELPAGSGLSSSAALELATALFLLKLHQRELPPLAIAKACQRAEHRFAGVQSGLLDQVTSLFGRADHAVFFDCRTEEVRTIPFPKGLTLIIAESGKKRELASGDYNRRRAETRAAADALQVPALRDVTSLQLKTRHDLPELLRGRAAHIVEENERVWRAVDFLLAGDGPGFGALLNASHESSRRNFENSTPELDLLVSIAQNLPGVLGARLTGGGFGGATITLCEQPAAEEVATQLAKRYRAESGITSRVIISAIAAGAR